MVASRETIFIRQSITDALRIAGGLFAYRRKYNQRDINQEAIEHCPYCYDEVLKQVKNSRCKYCYGTGMAGGGYRPLAVVRAHLTVNSRDYENKFENAGIREAQDMTLKLPYEPLFNSGDVFAEILEMEDGIPKRLGRMFQIAGDVTWKTIAGIVSNNRDDLTLDLRDRIVSQEAQVKLLLETDDKYLVSDEFWGLDYSYNPDESGYKGPIEIEDTDVRTRYHSSGWAIDGDDGENADYSGLVGGIW